MSDEFAGALTQRVALQYPVDEPDGGGGYTRSWRSVQDVWAHVSPRALDERRFGGHTATHQRFDLLIRKDGRISAEARLMWRGLALTILSILDDPQQPDRLLIVAEQEREQ